MSTAPTAQPYGPPPDWSQFYLSHEASVRLAVSKDRLHQLRQQGLLLAYLMPNGAYLFDKLSVDTLAVERQMERATKQARQQAAPPESPQTAGLYRRGMRHR